MWQYSDISSVEDESSPSGGESQENNNENYSEKNDNGYNFTNIVIVYFAVESKEMQEVDNMVKVFHYNLLMMVMNTYINKIMKNSKKKNKNNRKFQEMRIYL